MKYIIISVIQIITGILHEDYTKYLLLKESKDSMISAYIGFNNYYDEYSYEWKVEPFPNSVILVSRDKLQSDTIEIFNSQNYISCSGLTTNIGIDSFEFTIIDLNNKGRKGVLLTLKTNEFSVAGESATIYVEKTTHEVWDIKTRKRIFSSVTSYSEDEHHFGLIDTIYYDYHNTYYYLHPMEFSGGMIKTGNIKTNYNLEDEEIYECLKPILATGNYFYKRNKFIRIEENISQ